MANISARLPAAVRARGRRSPRRADCRVRQEPARRRAAQARVAIAPRGPLDATWTARKDGRSLRRAGATTEWHSSPWATWVGALEGHRERVLAVLEQPVAQEERRAEGPLLDRPHGGHHAQRDEKARQGAAATACRRARRPRGIRRCRSSARTRRSRRRPEPAPRPRAARRGHEKGQRHSGPGQAEALGDREPEEGSRAQGRDGGEQGRVELARGPSGGRGRRGSPAKRPPSAEPGEPRGAQGIGHARQAPGAAASIRCPRVGKSGWAPPFSQPPGRTMTSSR